MASVATPGTIHCANLTQVALPHDGLSRLDYTCLSLYLLWLIVILLVMFTEWNRRKRSLSKSSVHVWITWLPFLAGIMPFVFAIISTGLKLQQTESYGQSQATRDFLEVCSNPLTQGFNSSIAIQTFLTDCNAVQNRMNADIGGFGFRISLYISLAVAVLSSLAGHFHQEKTAVKEIGTAQLASMLSMTFALLRFYTALNFWQVMVAIMSLDITSAVVQMALSQKDTLASRWWVVLNAISQSLAQTSLCIVLGKTFPMSFANQDPCQPCVRAIWWGTFDPCKEVPWTFWIYWTLRTLLIMRSCAIALHHMHFYDLGERIERDEKSSQEVSWSSHLLRHLTLTDPMENTIKVNPQEPKKIKTRSQKAFPRMPATTLTDWILWTLLAVVAMSSLERMLSRFDISNPGNIKDWGQTTTFMAVVSGLVARAIYLFYAKSKR